MKKSNRIEEKDKTARGAAQSKKSVGRESWPLAVMSKEAKRQRRLPGIIKEIHRIHREMTRGKTGPIDQEEWNRRVLPLFGVPMPKRSSAAKPNRTRARGAVELRRGFPRPTQKPPLRARSGAGKTAGQKRPRETKASPTIHQPGGLRGYVRPQWIGERVSQFTDEPKLARDFWFQHIASCPIFDADKECLAVLLLNTKFKVIGWNMVSFGSLNETAAHPREILRPAVATAAFAMILMHNHPSGNTCPSYADHRCTATLAAACELMQIRLLDHVIVGREAGDE